MILNPFKRKKAKIKEVIYYNNCDIPARLFYDEVIGKENLSVLGDAPQDMLDNALTSIIDELCILENNKEMIDIYRKRRKVIMLSTTIHIIETILHRITFLPLTVEERLEEVETLNMLTYPRIRFNVDKSLYDEIERVQRIISSLNTELDAEVATDKKQKKNAVYNFHSRLVRVKRALDGMNIDENISLRGFVAHEKLALDIQKEHKNGK